MWRPFKEQGVEEEGAVVLAGAPYSTLLSSGLFHAGRKRRGVCDFFSHSLAHLSCGLAFRLVSARPSSCLFHHFTVKCTTNNNVYTYTFVSFHVFALDVSVGGGSVCRLQGFRCRLLAEEMRHMG